MVPKMSTFAGRAGSVETNGAKLVNIGPLSFSLPEVFVSRIHYIQHVPFEGLGSYAYWLDHRSYNYQGWRAYENQLPSLDDIDVLIVMGGPMGVHDTDQHPWLEAELSLLEACIKAGKQVLGVCLGAQLIAKAMGAEVKPHTGREIGWFPLNACGWLSDLPHPDAILHWHGDTFSLPVGAEPLGTTEYCANQGFAYNDNKVIALQFHVELDIAATHTLGEACANELAPGQSHVQSLDDILRQKTKFANARENADFIMEKFLCR